MPPIDFSLSVLYFLLTNSPHPTSAAPLLHDNTTRTDNGSFAPAWMKEPTGRGTPSMLINAFMTIALCVYTVLHMNTLPNMSAMRCILYQVKCVLIATFLPEIVLFGAYVDRIDAHRFHKEWCKRRGVEPESPEDTLGITGAFFVCMGGYSLGKAEDYEKFANMVTPNGLLFLIENGFVPAHLLRKRAIHDKNKACVWSKLLVFLQAIWILVKCVGRKNSGLPITLLEQHISLQVIFTLITHALWWNKPQNVTDPIPLVTDTELADLLVVMLFAKSTGELRYLQLELAPPTAISDECSKAEGSYDKEAVAPKFRIHTTGDRSTRRPLEEPVEKIYFFPRAGYVHRTSKLGKYGCRGRTITADSRDALRRGEIIITPDETITFGERLEVCYQSKLAGVIVLNKADIDNLLSMAEGVKALKHRRVVAALAGLEQADYERKAPLLRHRAEMICTDAYPVPKPPKSLGRTVRRLVRLLVMMLVSTVYGGWHLVAWNAHFPTPIERLLWRVASVIVAAIPPIVHVYLTRNRQKSNGKLVKKIVEKKLDVLCARMFDWTGYKLRLGDPISSLLLSIWNGFCWFVMALLISYCTDI